MFLGGRIRSEKVLACAAKGAASLSPQSGTNQESGTDELFHCVKLDHAAGMEWFAGDLHAVFTGVAIPFRLTDVAKLMADSAVAAPHQRRATPQGRHIRGRSGTGTGIFHLYRFDEDAVVTLVEIVADLDRQRTDAPGDFGSVAVSLGRYFNSAAQNLRDGGYVPSVGRPCH
jgi:hypothetical protein